ncbi:glycosyltransferase [Sphaerothrix gracilis]|uniref:glycosyltransferase family 4 protein n=1 Tax=Sphaerothrix gracilis TaxID=3151835 RepID=UPI0031FE402B
MTALKILISAYACRPHEGSEPGIGWHLVQELAKTHQVWVLTRANNQPAIAAELAKHPNNNLQVLYCDLPQWLQKLNRGQKLVHLHYYLWQIIAYRLARRLHSEIGFDLAHHVTYVRYWSPSFLSLLPVPFVWGPVGGGEATPRGFWSELSQRSLIYELLREGIHRISELDPFLRITARRSAIAYATTEDTARCLRRLGAERVEVLSQLGLSASDLSPLAELPPPAQPRLISIGRLLHWKGFHLGLQAFAQADLSPEVTYWIVGDGPERDRLRQLAQDLGIGERVKFWGKLSRAETLQKLADCSVLVHPSLHDSGALVCAEAMAAGRPVICLDQGGPALQVTAETGFKVPAENPVQAVQDMAAAMSCLAQEADTWQRLSQASRQRVQHVFSWTSKGQQFDRLYRQLLNLPAPSAGTPAGLSQSAAAATTPSQPLSAELSAKLNRDEVSA